VIGALRKESSLDLLVTFVSRQKWR